jgi:hypothetical protein
MTNIGSWYVRGCGRGYGGCLGSFDKWIAEGFIVAQGEGNKNRRYELVGKWIVLIG